MTLFEPIEVALRVAGKLRALGIDFLVGGSVASSLHGIPRSTQDVDLVARMRREHVGKVVAAFEQEFYVAREAVAEAVDRRTCFNLIDNRTMMKVDIFVAADDDFSRDEFARAEVKDTGEGELKVASAEHMVVEKLRWYRLGGGVSERQWRDVIGMLKVKGATLDFVQVRRLAALVDVGEELAHALQEVGR